VRLPAGRGVRHSRENGFEMWCFRCREWWPLDIEFWYPALGLNRCRACIAEAARESRDGRAPSPDQVAATKAYQAAYRRYARREKHAYAEAYRKTHRAELAAKSRAAYQKNRDAILAKKRAEYAADREGVLARQRERYARRRAA
jgi:hypothetical protein